MNPDVRELQIPSAAPRKTHMGLSLRTGEGGGVGSGRSLSPCGCLLRLSVCLAVRVGVCRFPLFLSKFEAAFRKFGSTISRTFGLSSCSFGGIGFGVAFWRILENDFARPISCAKCSARVLVVLLPRMRFAEALKAKDR